MLNTYAYENACRRYGIVTATMATLVLIVRELLEMEI